MIRKIDDISVNYIEEGEGDVVLLLHGWGANITLYQGIIDTLKRGRRVIALDLPGFGKALVPVTARNRGTQTQIYSVDLEVRVQIRSHWADTKILLG